jgi:hypothetical protein
MTIESKKQNFIELVRCIEKRWDGDQLSAWLDTYDLSYFFQLVGNEPYDAKILNTGWIYIDLVPMCEYYGIDPEEIFPKKASLIREKITALDIYYILYTKDRYRHWAGEQLLIQLDSENILKFCDLIEAYLKHYSRNIPLSSDGYYWVDLIPICKYYGIDPEEIFPKPTN